MEQKPTYTEALTELKELVFALDGSDVSIDEIEPKLERASLLISICKASLKEVEDKTNEILSKLESVD